jgi:hypothetical protein
MGVFVILWGFTAVMCSPILVAASYFIVRDQWTNAELIAIPTVVTYALMLLVIR